MCFMEKYGKTAPRIYWHDILSARKDEENAASVLMHGAFVLCGKPKEKLRFIFYSISVYIPTPSR